MTAKLNKLKQKAKHESVKAIFITVKKPKSGKGPREDRYKSKNDLRCDAKEVVKGGENEITSSFRKSER